MKHAAIGPIAVHLPERIETTPTTSRRKSHLGYGVDWLKNRNSGPPTLQLTTECSSDLGVKAAEKLFVENQIDPASIDYLLFCTQTPDYALPTTACLIQERLGLRTNIGAVDFNLGCSGFVYGLSLAEGFDHERSRKTNSVYYC